MPMLLQDFSYTMKINQKGQLIELDGRPLPIDVDESFSSLFGVPGFGSYFISEEVKVGESWETPIDKYLALID